MSKIVNNRGSIFFEGSEQDCEAYLQMVDTLRSCIEAKNVADHMEDLTFYARLEAFTVPEMVALCLDPDHDCPDTLLYTWLHNLPADESTSYTRTILHEGDDSHAGNYVPTTSTTWLLEGHLFEVYEYPDWDNYHSDFIIRRNGTVIAEMRS